MLSSLAPKEQRDSVSPIHPRDPALALWFGAGDGAAVTPDSAMRVTAVYACVSLIAETLAALPLHVYRLSKDAAGKLTEAKAEGHPLYALIHDAPAPGITSFEWREMLLSHTALRGDSYARIVTDASGKILELPPIHPDHITPQRGVNGGRPTFRWRPRGVGPDQILLDDEVLRVPYKMLDGLNSLSPISVHKRTIGNSIAAARYLESFYRNSAQPKGALTTDKTLTPDAARVLRASWEEKHQGPENAGRLAIFDGGLKFEAIGMSMDDAQYIELQNFSVTDIARIYLVPPHKIGELSKATFSNIEHQAIEFVVGTLVSWMKRVEQRMNGYLLSARDRSLGYFIRFDEKGLLRGDAAARAALYKALFYIGAISSNEIRALEQLNPYEGGDRYYVQQATVPVDKLDEIIERMRKTPAPQKEPDDADPKD